jgi:hypothetical protein
MSPRRVVVGGLPYFGRRMADLLSGPDWECRYVETPAGQPWAWVEAAKSISTADLVYLIGGQIERGSRPDWLLRVKRCPVVMHWVGSDVSYALALDRNRESKELISRPVHWAEVPWTAEELLPLRITAELVPLAAIRVPASTPALPERFTVLVYLPDSRPQFYRRDLAMRLAESLPAAQFLVAGGRGEGCVSPPNVEHLGWNDDMSRVYERCTVLLRLPEHDGMSFMVLEALAAGRHVIWNHPLRGVIEVTDEDSARAELGKLLTEHENARLAVNEAGRRLVREQFAPERVRGEILSRFEHLLGRGRAN